MHARGVKVVGGKGRPERIRGGGGGGYLYVTSTLARYITAGIIAVLSIESENTCLLQIPDLPTNPTCSPQASSVVYGTALTG